MKLEIALGLAGAASIVLGTYALACVIGLLLGNESLTYVAELWWARVF